MKKTINQTELVMYEINRILDLLISSTLMDGKYIGEITQLLLQNRSISKEVNDILVQRSLKEKYSPIKLRLLYVIDSLIKHIGKDFIQNISPNIFRIYEEAYTSADDENKINLFKLYYSWKYFLDSALIESLCSRFNFNKMKSDLQRDKPELIEKYDKYNEGVRETLSKEGNSLNIAASVTTHNQSTNRVALNTQSTIRDPIPSNIVTTSASQSSNFESKDLKKSFLRDIAITASNMSSKIKKGESNLSESLFSSQSSSPTISKGSSDGDSSYLRKKQKNPDRKIEKKKTIERENNEFHTGHIQHHNTQPEKRQKTEFDPNLQKTGHSTTLIKQTTKPETFLQNEPTPNRKDQNQIMNTSASTGAIPKMNINTNVQMINQQLINWMHSGMRKMANVPNIQNPQQIQNMQSLPDYIKNNVYLQNLMKSQMQVQAAQINKKPATNSFYDSVNTFILSSQMKLSTNSNLFSSLAKFFSDTIQESDPVKEIIKENKDIRNKMDILKIKDFNSKESYKDLYRRCLDSLYSDIKNSCPICGFRTKIYSKFLEHLDIHFNINFIKRNSQKKVLYRRESSDKHSWIKGISHVSEVSSSDQQNSFDQPSYMLSAVLFYQNDNYQQITNKKISNISDNIEDNEHFIVPIQPDEVIKCVYCGEEFKKKYIQKFYYWFYVNVVKLSYEDIRNYKEILNSLNHNFQKNGYVLIHESCVEEFLKMVKFKDSVNLLKEKKVENK